MAEKKKETGKKKENPKADVEGPAAGEGQFRIRWDQASARSVYANVINAQGTREEIVLFFGMNQAWDANQREMTVQLTDRVVLNPFAAKRLFILLGNVLKEYEKKYGTLDVESRKPAGG